MLNAIVAAVIHLESRGNPDVVSRDGCVGLMQVHPRWTKYSAEQLKDPAVNRQEGTRLLKYWLRRAHGNWPRALAAYNCGWRGLEGKCGTGYAQRVCQLARCAR